MPGSSERQGTPTGASRFFSVFEKQENDMNKDQIKGAAKQVKGAVKEAAGSVTNSPRTEAEGKADKLEGKVQKGYGDLKQKIKDAL